MSTYDGGISSGGGLAPHRVRGVQVQRTVPIVPEPPVKEPVYPTEMETKYQAWFSVHAGTYPEFLAFDWLERQGLEWEEDFYFQSSRLGGRQLWGGAVVDFDFPTERLAWRIQGEYFHIGNPAKEASDAMQKMALANIGYTCVDILAQDVIQRRNWILSHALNGEQMRSLHEGGF